MMASTLSRLRSFSRFSGRSSKRGFWRAVAISLGLVPAVLLVIVPIALKIATPEDWSPNQTQIAVWPFLGYCTYALMVFAILLPVTARRLHDTGRSARWLLIGYVFVVAGWVVFALLARSLILSIEDANDYSGFGYGYLLGVGIMISLMWLAEALVTLAGAVVLFTLCSKEGAVGPNRYGPDPLRPELGDTP